MADPNIDHGFVYTEDGYTDIAASPFFDVKLGLDTTVNGYIERIRYTLVKSLEVQLGVFRRLEPDFDELPLHPSYIALQTLYREDHTFGPSPVADLPVPPSLPSGNLTGIRYFSWILLIVALFVLIKLFCLA